MQIRAAKPPDLEGIREIDGTIESARYLHLDHLGEGFAVTWKLEERLARQKLIEANRLTEDAYFVIKQIVSGINDGAALLVELEGSVVAALVAQPEPERETLRIVDLRVDYDYRRQGMGTALVYQIIQHARDMGVRAISAESLSNNLPAASLLARCGFELSGVDMRRRSNHDVVKEAVTLFWYVTLD